jgi:hypothetical protein
VSGRFIWLLVEESGAMVTSQQVDALTHAWLDMKASLDFLNEIEDLLDRCEIGELQVALKQSIKELEEAYPFMSSTPLGETK